MDSERKAQALDLVQHEALALDEQRWDNWLALYEPDAVFWMPMWKSEGQPNTDPDTELSFIFLQGHLRLQERVRRVTSGTSIASRPIPRTAHLVGPGLATAGEEAGTVVVRSAFRSQVFLHKDNQTVEYAGRYTHVLAWSSSRCRILRKTIILNCDYLQSKLDFFYV